jgi:hypothetical protein
MWLVRRKKVSVGRKLPRILIIKTREAYFAMQLRYTDFFLNCVQQTRKTAVEEKKGNTQDWWRIQKEE